MRREVAEVLGLHGWCEDCVDEMVEGKRFKDRSQSEQEINKAFHKEIGSSELVLCNACCCQFREGTISTREICDAINIMRHQALFRYPERDNIELILAIAGVEQYWEERKKRQKHRNAVFVGGSLDGLMIDVIEGTFPQRLGVEGERQVEWYELEFVQRTGKNELGANKRFFVTSVEPIEKPA